MSVCTPKHFLPRALTAASLKRGTVLAAGAGERQMLSGSCVCMGVSDETRSHSRLGLGGGCRAGLGQATGTWPSKGRGQAAGVP